MMKEVSRGITVCGILISILLPLMGAQTMDDPVSVGEKRKAFLIFDHHKSQSHIRAPPGTPGGASLAVTPQGSHYTVSYVSHDNPPNPPQIEGAVTGKIRTIYFYNVTVTDPLDESLIYLEVDFGDGTAILQDCGCNSGPWPSGSVIMVEHAWKKQGAFQLQARVQDVSGLWSEWGALEVAMAKSLPIPLWEVQGRLQGILSVFLR